MRCMRQMIINSVEVEGETISVGSIVVVGVKRTSTCHWDEIVDVRRKSVRHLEYVMSNLWKLMAG